MPSRRHHEPIEYQNIQPAYPRNGMSMRRDIAQVFLFSFIVLVIMVIISQVLVIHSGERYGKNIRTEYDFLPPGDEILEAVTPAPPGAAAVAASVDRTIQELKLREIPGLDQFRNVLKNEIYANRISNMILDASGNASDIRENNGSAVEMEKNVDLGLADENVILVRTSVQHNNITNDSAVLFSHELDFCPEAPVNLTGRVFVQLNHTHNMSRDDLEAGQTDLKPGGIWRPPDCVARHRVAIIIPYRDREMHLVTLLAHLLPILQRQQLNFRIFVVEQRGNDTFNKARIMNAAFKEASKLYDFQCFVFHDVDLIPEDDRNMYSCPQHPRHMSVAIDEMDYKVPYDYLVGGVLSMRAEHFQLVNGYSNLYWGWGAEDDDMAFRIMHVGLKITRPPSKVARYTMIKHEKRKPTDWKKRSRLLRTGTRRFNFDGLNSVNYDLVHIKLDTLYTHVLVDIGKPPIPS